MREPDQRQYLVITTKTELEGFLENLNSKTAIFFGKTTEDYPYTDHGCIVDRKTDSLYSYIVEGHGIGSNEKPPSDLQDTVRRIFTDCQRFGGDNTVTIEVPKKWTKHNK